MQPGTGLTIRCPRQGSPWAMRRTFSFVLFLMPQEILSVAVRKIHIHFMERLSSELTIQACALVRQTPERKEWPLNV